MANGLVEESFLTDDESEKEAGPSEGTKGKNDKNVKERMMVEDHYAFSLKT